jgi:hypothetical protein
MLVKDIMQSRQMLRSLWLRVRRGVEHNIEGQDDPGHRSETRL